MAVHWTDGLLFFLIICHKIRTVERIYNEPAEAGADKSLFAEKVFAGIPAERRSL